MMTKEKEDVRVYNLEWKKAFIESEYKNEDTQKGIMYDFKKAYMMENLTKKDMSIFNAEEIQELAKTLNYTTESSLRRALSYFANYTNWCMNRGLRGENETGYNDFTTFISAQNLADYLPKMKIDNMYITEEELEDIENILINPMDSAIVQALFEGISGKALYELRSITLSNLENNNLLLTDEDGSERTVQISDKLIGMLKEADAVQEYILENGNSIRGQIRQLEESKYVFKPFKNKNSLPDEILSYHMIFNKITAIQKHTDYNFITTTSIRDSGAIKKVRDWTEEKEMLYPDIDIFKKLEDKSTFNMSRAQTVTLRKKYAMLNGMD